MAFLAIAAFDVAAGIEQWPFSQYRMYADSQSSRYSWLELAGESGAGEIALPVRAFEPFNEGRLATALGRVPLDSLDSALADCRRIYDRNRAEGRYDGPPISGMKLYLVTWNLDEGPAPARKVLVRESN
jgi:hypothetical protein